MAVHHRIDVRPRLVDLAVDEALAVEQRALVAGSTGWLSRSSARMSAAVTNSRRHRARHQVAIRIARVAHADMAEGIEHNTGMFELYGDAARVFKKNILAKHPVILALFSGAGGRLLLYRPGHSRIEAPPVPEVYQLLKSVGHATMVLSVLAGPHSTSRPTRVGLRPWRRSGRSAGGARRAGQDLDPGGMARQRAAILQANIAFMDESLKKGVITFDAVAAFTKKQGPLLKKNIAWAAQTQVGHWMGVLAEWKKMLGPDWDKTYAPATPFMSPGRTISCTACWLSSSGLTHQYRLILIETVSFTTTPEDMLDSLTRIVADRTVGALFFGDKALMDYELMGGDAREAIVAETAKRGMTPFLPPLVPFGSKQWPMLVTPGDWAQQRMLQLT